MSSSTFSKYGFGIIFLIGILLVYTLASTSIHSIEVADLGLIKRLPTSFWVGLILLGYLWYISKKSKYYSIAALILTVSYLFVAPAIIKVPPWISQSYYPFGESMLINSSGHLVYRPTAIFKSYYFWPGFLYLASTFTLVTGMPHDILLKYFPLLTISLYGLLVFLVLRVKLKVTYSIFGAAWFLSCFFLRQQYFGPPSIAFIFFLMIFLILSWLFFGGKTKRKTLVALLFFLFAVTTFTHVLTSFMVVVVVIALYLTRRFVRSGVYFKGSSSDIAKLAIFFAVIFFSYNMLVTPDFFDWTVGIFWKVFFGVRELGLYKEPQRIVGSTAQQLNYMSSLAIMGLNGAVILVALLQAIRNRHMRAQTVKKAYFLFCIILLVALGLFALTAEYGPHESYQRAFMFAIMPLSYLCIYLLSRKPRILPVILIGLLFLNIPAQYGSDSYTLATDTELTGAAFFAAHTPQNISCLHKHSMYIRYYDPQKNIKFLIIGTLPLTSLPNASAVNEVVNKADYIILSELQNNYYLYFLGVNPLDQVDFERLNRIYDNWSLRTFKHANETSLP